MSLTRTALAGSGIHLFILVLRYSKACWDWQEVKCDLTIHCLFVVCLTKLTSPCHQVYFLHKMCSKSQSAFFKSRYKAITQSAHSAEIVCGGKPSDQPYPLKRCIRRFDCSELSWILRSTYKVLVGGAVVCTWRDCMKVPNSSAFLTLHFGTCSLKRHLISQS